MELEGVIPTEHYRTPPKKKDILPLSYQQATKRVTQGHVAELDPEQRERREVILSFSRTRVDVEHTRSQKQEVKRAFKRETHVRASLRRQEFPWQATGYSLRQYLLDLSELPELTPLSPNL